MSGDDDVVVVVGHVFHFFEDGDAVVSADLLRGFAEVETGLFSDVEFGEVGSRADAEFKDSRFGREVAEVTVSGELGFGAVDLWGVDLLAVDGLVVGLALIALVALGRFFFGRSHDDEVPPLGQMFANQPDQLRATASFYLHKMVDRSTLRIDINPLSRGTSTEFRFSAFPLPIMAKT